MIATAIVVLIGLVVLPPGGTLILMAIIGVWALIDKLGPQTPPGTSN